MRALSKKDETRLRKILHNSPRDFDPDLFVAKIAVEDEPYVDADGVDHGACWCWCAGLYPNGYGKFSLRGSPRKLFLPHRLVAEAMVGRELERHELALHRCDDKRCVRPNHLFIGTHSDGMQLCHQKDRFATRENGRRAPRKKEAELPVKFGTGTLWCATSQYRKFVDDRDC